VVINCKSIICNINIVVGILFLSSKGAAQVFSAEVKRWAATEGSTHHPQLKHARDISGFDICYHRLEISVDPSVRWISGKVTTFVRFSEAGSRELVFDLSDSLSVEKIAYRGQPLTTFTHQDDQLKLTLPGEDAIDSVSIWYQGRPAFSGFGSFVTTLTPGGKPVLWTLSEPYGARDWWPCKQSLSDKIDSLDILVTTPEVYSAASNGLLIKRDTAEGRKLTHHWRHRYPITTYLVAIAVTDYAEIKEEISLRDGKMLLHDFVFPEDEPDWLAARPMVRAVVQYFDSLITPYPFTAEKYGHAQFGWGGGMEHQTMSFMANLDPGLTAHELAHQWFGNQVTCGSWADIWLNEGFATYLTGMYYERFKPDYWPKWKDDQRNYVFSLPFGSVYCPDTNSVGRLFDGRLSYAKGAMVLNMLRMEIGDQVFLEMMRYYLASNKTQGFVRTIQLQEAAEVISGRDLGRFFQQWVYGSGHDSLQISWSASADLVALKVSQKPTSTAIDQDSYLMQYPVLLIGNQQDTLIRLNLEKREDQFLIYTGFKVEEIIPDPGSDYLAAATTNRLATYPGSGGSILAYPNPASGFVTLRLESPTNLPDAIYLQDLAGRQIKLAYTTVENGLLQINIRGYASGIYLLQCIYPEKVLGIPFLISRP
jgi:aminopeptidase N